MHMHRLAHRHLERLNVLRTWRQEQVRAGGLRMVPRARNGRYGGLGTRTARVPGRWVRWIGWIWVRDAERDVCGVEHLRGTLKGTV